MSPGGALSQAVKLTARTDARLHLCYIADGAGFVTDINFGLNIPEAFPDAKEARIQLQKILALISVQVDGEVHVRLNKSPLAGLLSLIRELKPDLVIVGSHGKGALKRALLGSVSMQLSRRTSGHEQFPEPSALPPEPELQRSVAQSQAATTAAWVWDCRRWRR